MRLLITFAALFLSIILLQLGSGSMAPLDVLSGLKLGFTNTEIGLLGSAQFFGFFIGCWWAPRLMGTIGHSRTFAVFAAAGTIGAIAHGMIVDPTVWAGLRICNGLCVAGCYTVIEAWMQAKVNNETRGRVMGVYRIVDIGASTGAQLMIGVLEPASYVSYNLLAILCCACLFPLTLSTARQPETPPAPRLRPLETARVSPLGVAGVIIAGLTSASFRTVGPLYGNQIGLTAAQIGYWLAAVLIGGAIAQLPAGWLADKFDRRWVLIGLSMLSTVVCATVAIQASVIPVFVFGSAVLFGMATNPIFSVSAAHANDFAEPGKMVEINASLMFYFGVGAILSPLVASNLVQYYGPSALFGFIALAHLLLVGFSLTRMLARPTREVRTRYSWLPRTSFTVGWVFRRQRRRSGSAKPNREN